MLLCPAAAGSLSLPRPLRECSLLWCECCFGGGRPRQQVGVEPNTNLKLNFLRGEEGRTEEGGEFTQGAQPRPARGLIAFSILKQAILVQPAAQGAGEAPRHARRDSVLCA